VAGLQQGVFSTREDQFIVEPLWNETATISDDDAPAAAAAAVLYHVIYRRSAVKEAAAHAVDRCGLRGMYAVTCFTRQLLSGAEYCDHHVCVFVSCIMLLPA